MTGRRRAWQVAAWFCWAVALVIVIRPVTIDIANTDDSVECGRIFEARTTEYLPCREKASGRLDTLLIWAVLTAPVTLGYLTSRTPRAPRPDEA